MKIHQTTSTEPGKIININPEPIGLYFIEAKTHQAFKEKLLSVWEDSPTELRQQYQDHTNHICNKSGQNLFKDFPELIEIQNHLKGFIEDYLTKIGLQAGEITIHSSWLNKAEKNSTLGDHSHSNSFISANYFVSFNPKVHSQLLFRNDRAQVHPTSQPFMTTPLATQKTIYTTPYIGFGSKEGEVVVWRSQNIHGYSEPNKEGNRITLSLNCMPKILDNGSYRFSIND